MELYPHQKQGIARAVAGLRFGTGGFYLNWAPGLGKTLGAIMVARLLNVPKIVVVTNTAGIGVWEREIRRFDREAAGAVCRNDGGRSWNLGKSPRRWLITNYEQMRDTDKPVYQAVATFRADLFIIDEAQYVKSPSSQQQKAIAKLARKARYRLLLSGTPAHNPLDWWAQYRLVDPDHEMWDRTFTAFKQDIAIPHPTIQFAVDGFRPHVVNKAKEAMARVTHVAKSEDIDVPAPVETIIPVDLEPRARKAYADMRDEMIAELADDTIAAPIALVKFLRLHQITGGFPTSTTHQTVRVGTEKLDILKDVLRERIGQKVIVACAFRPEIEAIANMIGNREGSEGFKGKPRYVLTITGDDSPAEKTRKEHLFQTSKHPIVLVVQYKAGGTALTLTAAHSLVIYSMQPSVIALRQMIGRSYRIGQTRHVQILPLLATNTVDESMWDGLKAGLDAVDLSKYLKERL